jgi:mono/diheme cytochrome c family protein
MIVLALLLLIILPFELWASPVSSVENGKALFDGKCSPCHTIGGGVRVGPDLKGIADLRPEDWLANFISNPGKMFQLGDPYANNLLNKFGGVRMPALGLSEQQVSDVLTYLRSLAVSSQAVAPTRKATSTPPLAGSPAEGEKLFIGLISFKNGGPSCVSCHDISRIPFPGGGTLGPDLTGAYTKFGGPAMGSILATLPFPTMRPIFDNRPLNFQEQGNLAAFFREALTQQAKDTTAYIVLSGIGGFIILLMLAWRVWHGRLLAVRRFLVEKEMKAGGAQS